MKPRLLPALLVTAALFVAACSAPAPQAPAQPADSAPAADKTEPPGVNPSVKVVRRDWPMFGGTPRRNLVNLLDKGIATDWSMKKNQVKNLKWEVVIGTRGYVPPAVAGGKVFIATNNQQPRDPKVRGPKAVLMCFEEATGKFLWQITHDMPPPDVVGTARDDGLLSTPAVEGDRLYYVAPAAEVVCADTDGKVHWRLDMMKELQVFPCHVSFSAPLVAGDLVFVVTGNGRVGSDPAETFPSPKAPSFVAIDKKTGKVVWKDSSPGEKVLEGQWASPAYAEVNGKPQVIFPGGDGWLYAFEPQTGKPVWKFDCNPKDAFHKPGGRGTRNYVIAPVVHDNKVYTASGQNPENGAEVSHFWCIDITKTGDVSAELVTDDKETPPKTKPNPDSAVVWHFGGKDASDRGYSFGRSLSHCAVHDGLVYAADFDGFLYCLDAKTGKLYWQEDLKAAVWGSPLWVDGKVYIGDDQGYVHVLAHGKERKLINKVEMDEPIKAAPVVVNGVLYVVGDRHLYAIAGK